jgi:hypothetical protein
MSSKPLKMWQPVAYWTEAVPLVVAGVVLLASCEGRRGVAWSIFVGVGVEPPEPSVTVAGSTTLRRRPQHLRPGARVDVGGRRWDIGIGREGSGTRPYLLIQLLQKFERRGFPTAGN